MGFKAYKAAQTLDGDWHLHDGVPIRFSGPNGLVAMWVRANRETAERPWRVAPYEWLSLVLPDAEAAARWLVFEQEEDGREIYSRLILVNGVAQRKVELMFTFAPLDVAHPEPALRVHAPDRNRLWSEELALDGGPFSSNCSWRWTQPHLTVGAATMRPARTASG